MSYRKTRIGSVFVLGVCMMALSAPRVSAAAVQGGQPVVNAKALNGLGTLAFCWRHDVWTVRDGQVHNMGAGVLPTLSTSGRYVAYMKEGGSSSGTLWVARTDGSGHPVAPLAKTPVTANGYVWLPGTDRLVVAASYWTLGGHGQRSHSASKQMPSLWLVNALTDRKTVIASNGLVDSVAASSDMIAYSVRRLSDVLFVDSLQPHSSPKPLVSAARAGIQLAGIAGKQVLYWVEPQHSESIAADGMVLYRIRANGGRPQSLATTLGYPSWLSAANTSSSLYAVVGGPRLAWTGKTLRRYDLATGTSRWIAGNTAWVALDPAADPATGRLAFVRAANLSIKTWGFSSPGPLETWVASRTLWVTRPGGIAPKPVAAAGYGIYRPEWTAHPDVILYAKGRGLWLVNMSAGQPIQVVCNVLGSTENDQFGFYGHRFLANEYAWVP